MRKTSELKAMAREKMFRRYGTLAAGTVIYGAIVIGIGMALLVIYSMNLLVNGVFNSIETMQAYVQQSSTSYSYTLMYEIAFVFIGAITCVFAGGVQYMCLKTARGEEIKISDTFFVIKNNPDKVIIIYLVQQLLMFLFNIPADILAVFANNALESGILDILYFIFVIIGYVADIIVITLFSQAVFLYLDNPQEKVFSCIEKSFALMRNYYGTYIKLIISFIPLYLLVIFTLGLAYIWVIPFQYTVMALYYMQLKGEVGSRIDVTIQ